MDGLIARSLGAFHRSWMRRPWGAAVAALLWYGVVCGAAARLGILREFHIPGRRDPVSGFWTTHWGVLFLIAMPAAAMLIGIYLRAVENAFAEIDGLVHPADNEPPFSGFLVTRLRGAWRTWILPACIALPMLLTVLADGRDIIAPLDLVAHTDELDWSNVGHLHAPTVSAANYFAFNVAAWGMQLFLGYCALLVLALTGYVLAVTFHYGLGGNALLDLFRVPGRKAGAPIYRPKWSYGTRRCGLEKLDAVFLTYVFLHFLVLVISGASIVVNASRPTGPDLGSAILAVGCVVLLPVSTFWVFHPYFTNFPDALPDDFAGKPGVVSPSPWPFGSQLLSWGPITLVAGFWLALFVFVLKEIMKVALKSQP